MFTATRATSLRTHVGVMKVFAIAASPFEEAASADGRERYLRAPGPLSRRFQSRACATADADSPGGSSETTGELPTGCMGGFAVLTGARAAAPDPLLETARGANADSSKRRITGAAAVGVVSDSRAS